MENSWGYGIQVYRVRPDGTGEIRWEDGSVHPSSVNYVHQKDAHFHAAAERALESAPGREEA